MICSRYLPAVNVVNNADLFLFFIFATDVNVYTLCLSIHGIMQKVVDELCEIFWRGGMCEQQLIRF